MPALIGRLIAVAQQDKGSDRGEEAFRRRYSELFGERWPLLEEALASDGDSVGFVAGSEEGCEAPPPYYLDSASVFAASCLELPTGGLVLDACAAPAARVSSSPRASPRAPGSCRTSCPLIDAGACAMSSTRIFSPVCELASK